MINILDINEISLDEAVKARTFDLFLGYLCNETRSIHVLKRAYEHCANKVLLVEARTNGTGLPHPRWAKKAEQIEVIFREDELADELLEASVTDRLNSIGDIGAPISILLDISSMPRAVMASIMATFEDIAATRQVDMLVAYCLAKYTPPLERNPANKTVKPVHPSFTGFSIAPGLPVAAIVGLGYEKGKALGAVEYVESSDWWVFVPTSEEKKYFKKVEQHNQTILNVIGADRKFEYSIHSPLLTTARLESLVASLSFTHKTVLLPFGPKIFFFCSLLVALVHKTCAVWHVTGEMPASRADVSPSAFVMCLSFTLAASNAAPSISITETT